VSAAPTTAIVLAAGMGSRLQDVWSDLPKGFVEIGGETLIERSIRLLQERAVERVVVVAGHLAHAYHQLAKRIPGVEVVDNPDYADTGSMASLARALERVDEAFLLLESDLFYEERALDTLLADAAPDVLLASGPTGATDEVWVEALGGRLTGLSKDPAELREVCGELVGILKVSSSLGRLLGDAFADFERVQGHGRMAYETDALVQVAQKRPVRVTVVNDLLWGEVDYETHYRRVRDDVYPRWAAGRTSRTSGPKRE